MEIRNHEISRRDLVKISGVAALGALSAGALAGCSSENGAS